MLVKKQGILKKITHAKHHKMIRTKYARETAADTRLDKKSKETLMSKLIICGQSKL